MSPCCMSPCCRIRRPTDPGLRPQFRAFSLSPRVSLLLRHRLPTSALIYVGAVLIGALALVSQFVDRAGTALVGYGLVIVVCVWFFVSPQRAILASLGLKPVIDMFWWTKGEGLLSPLFIVGVAVPALALLRLPKVARPRLPLVEDRFVLAYLGSLMLLTIVKIISTPQYLSNSVDTFVRILSVTSFFFIGKYYFPTERDRRRLFKVLILAAVVPFGLTLGQQALGWDLTRWDEISDPGMETGLESAFYISARHEVQRISGVYEGIYTLAFLGVFTGLMLLAARLARDFRFGPALYLLMFASGYFAYFTYSRSAWVSLGVATLLFFLMRGERLRALVVVGVFSGMYLTIETVRFRFEDELGYVLGESDFRAFGYGRGGLWVEAMDLFTSRDLIHQLVGTYGQINPENQFLNVLFFFGLLGLVVFLGMLVYMSGRLLRAVAAVPRDDTLDNNLAMLFGSLIVTCYWFAGWGSGFFIQISAQWVLWLWTGVILAEERRRKLMRYRQDIPAGQPQKRMPVPVASYFRRRRIARLRPESTRSPEPNRLYGLPRSHQRGT